MKKKISLKKVLKKPFKSQTKVGQAPGTVTYQGNKADNSYTLSLTKYNSENYSVQNFENINQCISSTSEGRINWFNVKGLSNEKEIETLGKAYNLNSLLLEDTVNTHQRPKAEEYENCVFTVIKMMYLDEKYKLITEHVAMVLLEDTVILFQEIEKDVFDGVRGRLENKLGRIRERGADYLLFALLDAVIDQYFIILEHIYQQIEELEEKVYNHPEHETVNEIHDLKKEVLQIRKYVRPVRELLNHLLKTEHPLVKDDTKLYLRDALDHCMQIQENIELYREMIMNLMDIYMSNMSNKMNEVMKVLTIMASIFIPLTFIAGIYGMNFRFMPELEYKYGYFIVWGVMILVFIGMIIYFKRKKWL